MFSTLCLFFLIFKIEIFTSPLCNRQHFYNNQQITVNDYFSLSSPSSSSSLPDAMHEWEELLTSTGDRRAQFVLSPPSHGCPYSRREPLLSWVLDYAKRRKHSRNLSNICHSAKSEIGIRREFLLRNRCNNTEQIPPIPASASPLSAVQHLHREPGSR